MTFETRVNLSIKRSDVAKIKRKAETLGLSMSAFFRQAALLYAIKGDTELSGTASPQTTQGDRNDNGTKQK